VSDRSRRWIDASLLLAVSIFAVSGARLVPFHPDETSWLYQSRDLELLFSAPLSLAWRSEAEPTVEMDYRLLNAPLAKYVLGLGRLAAGFPSSSVAVDWSWSDDWKQNVAAGALPPERLLGAARTASAALLIPAMVALYFAGVTLRGRAAGLAAAILLGTNALVLLHGRRAMAEGALTLGVALATLGVLHAARRPGLAGAATALAFAAKTSAGVWIPIGLMAAVLPGGRRSRSWAGSLRRAAAYAASAVAVTVALHPVLWANPPGALGAMWRARQDLVASQVETTRRVMPWAVPATPAERAATMIVHLFLAPVQFAEAANYLEQTAASEAAYLVVPGHELLRGVAGGAVMLGLTVLGIGLAVARSRAAGLEERRATAIALGTTAVQAAALVIAVPLAFQRYVIPLVPLVCLWGGVGATRVFEGLVARRSRGAGSR